MHNEHWLTSTIDSRGPIGLGERDWKRAHVMLYVTPLRASVEGMLVNMYGETQIVYMQVHILYTGCRTARGI